MSVGSAKAFLARVKSDKDFNKAVGEISTKKERMEFIKNAGFEFTQDELDEVTGALSDDELDTVAGGSWGCGHTHEAEGAEVVANYKRIAGEPI